MMDSLVEPLQRDAGTRRGQTPVFPPHRGNLGNNVRVLDSSSERNTAGYQPQVIKALLWRQMGQPLLQKADEIQNLNDVFVEALQLPDEQIAEICLRNNCHLFLPVGLAYQGNYSSFLLCKQTHFPRGGCCLRPY
jgi:hypothetical protein